MLYDPKIPREEALFFEMEDEPDIAIETNIPPDKLPFEVRQYLCPSTGTNYFMEPSKTAGK
jgi:hypothetical protein